MQDASPPELPPATPPPSGGPPATINDLIDRHLAWADNWYRSPPPPGKHHRQPTREAGNIASAMQHLRRFAGSRPPQTLTADDLCAVQQQMLSPQSNRFASGRRGPLTRMYINKVVRRIQQMYAWAATPPRRWITAAQLTELRLCPMLVYGRCSARESVPVRGVDFATFKAACEACAMDSMREHGQAAMAALRLGVMLELHWETGMRPGELCRLNTAELTEEVADLPTLGQQTIMIYRPWRHKGRHHGFDRTIFINAAGAAIIRRWLDRQGGTVGGVGGLLFPAPTDPSRSTTPGDYRNRLAALTRRHRLDPFTPNQIRHAFATRMRKLTGGLDVVQTLMGHQHLSTTEIYAKPDAAAAIEAILRPDL